MGGAEVWEIIHGRLLKDKAKEIMEHRVYIRKHLADFLRWSLGESIVNDWVVNPLPRASTVDHMDKDQHWRRNVFFFSTYVVISIVGALLLEATRLCMNLYIKRFIPASKAEQESGGLCGGAEVAGGYHPVGSQDTPLMHSGEEDREVEEMVTSLERDNEEVEAELEAARKRVSGYDSQDLIFVAYQHVYLFSCLILASYAFLNDYLSEDFGLDYELYVPWLCGTVLMHICCVVFCFRKQLRKKRTFPCLCGVMPQTTLDFGGGLFGALKDAVAAGIYAQHSFVKDVWGPLFLSGVTVACIFLPNVWIYKDVHPFRDFQESLWPVVIAVDRQLSAKQEADQKALQKARQKSLDKESMWVTAKKFALQQVDAQTREHKQATAAMGDMPQAVAGFVFLWFYVEGKKSTFIIFVTMVAVCKSFMILVFRPHILCSLATAGLPWIHLTARDVRIATNCNTCTWIRRSMACRGMLRDEQTAPRVRVAAIDALLKLHDASRKGQVEKGCKSEGEDSKEQEQELSSIEHTVLWEVATQTDKQTLCAAQRVMQAIQLDPHWRKCAVLLRRLRSDDADEKVQAARELATHYPQYAGAYVRDLVYLLKTGHSSHDLHRPVSCGAGAKKECEGPAQGDDLETGCCSLLSSSTSRPSRDPEVTVDDSEAAEALEARAKAYRQMRSVREAASMALGILGMNLQQGGKAGKELTPEAHAKVQAAVLKVAKDIVKLLRNDNREVRSASLSAVVQFRGDAAVCAVDQAMGLLEGSGSHEKLKVGEIALVQLLPHMSKDAQRLKITKIVGLLREPEKSLRKATAHRVLCRLGGPSSVLVEEELGKQQGSEEKELQELRGVLACQKKAVEAMGSNVVLAEGLNLVLDRRQAEVGQAVSILEKVRAGKEVFSILKEMGLARKAVAEPDARGSVLPVFFSDLEPDDTMFVAEMWKYLREKGPGCCKPLVIFAVELEGKDGGDIFEKKLLLASLILGQVDFRVLTPDPETKQGEIAAVGHPLADKMAKLRSKNLDAITERILKFKGDVVRFYICAPGRGNIGALVESLGASPGTPGGSKKSLALPDVKHYVSLYSGQFNIKGMTESDINGLNMLVGEKGVLTDVGKFPFFGGQNNHPLTGGFGTFALPSFAPLLSSRHPLIAAVWGLVNDEFNRKLIAPDKLLTEVLVNVDQWPAYQKLYKEGKVKEYAQSVCNDKHVFPKVVKKKRLTLMSFACDCCDAPLCDQILFVHEWVKDNQPQAPPKYADLPDAAETWVHEQNGVWNLNKINQNTSVDTREGAPGLKAKQPLMRHTHDAEALYRMSEAMQDYTLAHLSELTQPMTEADVKECMLFS